MRWSSVCSQYTHTYLYLPLPRTHWPPGIGVATTFGTGFLAPVVPQCSCPSGVMTLRCFIAFATLVLSLELPLALRAAAATSNSARLGPSCWFQYLPEAFSYPAPSCLLVTPVSEEWYGHVGPQ